MFFTQDDYKKIEKWLQQRSRKDTQFPLSSSINGSELLPIIQDGENRVIDFNSFWEGYAEKFNTSLTEFAKCVKQKADTLERERIEADSALHEYIDSSLKSYPKLDGGLIPSSYLPSYVDDVLEYDTLDNFPRPGESGKIYVSKDTNLTYRWSGNNYVEISKSLALGETSGTAFPGNRGKALEEALENKLDKDALDEEVMDTYPWFTNLWHVVDNNKDALGILQSGYDNLTEAVNKKAPVVNGKIPVEYLPEGFGSGGGETTPSLQLGEIEGTAFEGNRGKSLEDWKEKLSGILIKYPTAATSDENFVYLSGYSQTFNNSPQNTSLPKYFTLPNVTLEHAGVMTPALLKNINDRLLKSAPLVEGKIPEEYLPLSYNVNRMSTSTIILSGSSPDITEKIYAMLIGGAPVNIELNSEGWVDGKQKYLYLSGVQLGSGTSKALCTITTTKDDDVLVSGLPEELSTMYAYKFSILKGDIGFYVTCETLKYKS